MNNTTDLKREELQQTLELVRVIDEKLITVNELHIPTVAVHLACARVREGLIVVARMACEELAPAGRSVPSHTEMMRFIDGLETKVHALRVNVEQAAA